MRDGHMNSRIFCFYLNRCCFNHNMVILCVFNKPMNKMINHVENNIASNIANKYSILLSNSKFP